MNPQVKCYIYKAFLDNISEIEKSQVSKLLLLLSLINGLENLVYLDLGVTISQDLDSLISDESTFLLWSSLLWIKHECDEFPQAFPPQVIGFVVQIEKISLVASRRYHLHNFRECFQGQQFTQLLIFFIQHWNNKKSPQSPFQQIWRLFLNCTIKSEEIREEYSAGSDWVQWLQNLSIAVLWCHQKRDASSPDFTLEDIDFVSTMLSAFFHSIHEGLALHF